DRAGRESGRPVSADPTPGAAPSPAPPAPAPDPASAQAPAPAVRLTALTKRFGRVTAVDGITLDIPAGQVVALLGPNGAGKTTTMDMVLGLQTPDSGEVLVHGHAPAQAVARGEVAAMMQDGGLLKDFTVTETVRYIASLYPDSLPVDEAVELAGLRAVARRRV